jgi:acyl phosphate:glycerol-3-phosphate acyltransferase
MPFFVELVALLCGYLIGSIPFGLLLTKAAGLGDVRKIGSGNIGATNVLRTGNKKLAAATLLLDALKGTLATVVAHYFFGPFAGMFAGLGAFLGHLFPIGLGFKGGKGVATYLGVLLGLAWQAALVFIGAWIAIAVITRYSSLAALIACVITPPVLFYIGFPELAALFAVMSMIIIVKHHANIQRLLSGTEGKIGSK